MGHKVNPVSFRVGISRNWKSRWFAEGGEYRKMFLEDVMLRQALVEKLKLAGVHDIEIERLPKVITIRVQVSRPGVVIGRGGLGIEETRNFILAKLGFKAGDPKAPRIEVRVEEIRNPELSARLVGQRIASEFERRLPHRRVVTKAVDRIMAAGAKGVKVALAGRIEGSEIARKEKYHKGSVPTQSLRADIDYAEERALLKRGYVGIKVWIYKGKQDAAA